MKKSPFVIGLLFWSSMFFPEPTVVAQTHVWDSATTGSWSTPARWNVNEVPTSVAQVLIDATGAPYTVNYDVISSTIQSLTLNSANLTFNLQSGRTLSLTDWNHQNGAATINGIVNLGGTMNITGGSVHANGATINGGKITSTAGLRLQGGTVTLNNVMLGDAINQDVLRLDGNSQWNFQGSTDFQTGFTPTIIGNSWVNYLTGKTLATDIVLGGSGASGNGTVTSGTAGQTITIHEDRMISMGGSGSIRGAGNWVNDGTIQNLTANASLTIRNSGTFVNNGLILAAPTTGSNFITIQSDLASFTNNGTLKANTGGKISIGENMTTAQLGNWDTTGGGVVELSQITLDNNAATLNLTTSRGNLNVHSGSIQGGTITADVGIKLISSGGPTLNNVVLGNLTNKDVLQINSNANWNFQGTTDFYSDFIPNITGNSNVSYLTGKSLATDIVLGSVAGFGNINSATAGQTLTIDNGRMISMGGAGNIQGVGNWINNRTIQNLTTSASLSIRNNGAFENNGLILAAPGSGTNFITVLNNVSSFTNNGLLKANTGGSIVIGEDLTTAQLGNWDTTGGGVVQLSGVTLNNSASTLNLTTARGVLSIQNGSIQGGTITADPGVRLTNVGSPILNNVFLGNASNKEVLRTNSGAIWNFQGTTDFQAGFTPQIGGNTYIMYLTGKTLETDFLLGDSGGFGSIHSGTAGQTVTIAEGRKISRIGNFNVSSLGGNGNWVNNGTLESNNSGGSLHIQNNGSFINNGLILAAMNVVNQSSTISFGGFVNSSLTNNGTLRADNGGLIFISGTQYWNLTNYNAGTQTLTGGTYEAFGNGQIHFNRTIANIGADTTVHFNGSQSRMIGLDGGTLRSMAGTLIVSGGKSLDVSSLGMNVESGGLLTGNGGILAGGLVTIEQGGVLSPGNSTGVLSFTNGLWVKGTYLVEIDDDANGDPIAGIDNDWVRILGGALNVDATSMLQVSFGGLNDFNDPIWSGNREWKIVDAVSMNIQSVWSNGQLNIQGGPNADWGLRVTNDAVYLTFTAVPEPSAMMLVGMVCIGLAVRRRSRVS
ncbi:MAG: PEP-CTERM sorting domain-containing protein [Pirellulaceae bacterium]|nr:PEP-CTERM sorting domain-containing protein [Pirellulaceae bacterium]